MKNQHSRRSTLPRKSSREGIRERMRLRIKAAPSLKGYQRPGSANPRKAGRG